MSSFLSTSGACLAVLFFAFQINGLIIQRGFKNNHIQITFFNALIIFYLLYFKMNKQTPHRFRVWFHQATRLPLVMIFIKTYMYNHPQNKIVDQVTNEDWQSYQKQAQSYVQKTLRQKPKSK